MGFVAGDRVKETTTGIGTGALPLAGAATGFQAVSSIPGIADGDKLLLVIAHQLLNEWETSVCTWASGAGTITRNTVVESSNSDALVNFSAGIKDVFCSLLAQSGSPLVNRRPKGRVNVPAGQSLYAPDQYEVQAAVQVELDADAVLEIG